MIPIQTTIIAMGVMLSSLSADAPTPKLVFGVTSPEVDLGNMPLSLPFEYSFSLHNEGEESLSLRLISQNCSCIDSVVYDALIEPNRQGTVKIGFDPGTPLREYWGRQELEVVFDTNDPTKKSFALSLSFNLAKPVELVDKEVDFGDIRIGTTSKKIFQIVQYGRNEDDLITRIWSPHDAIHVSEVKREARIDSTLITYQIALLPTLESDSIGFVKVQTSSNMAPYFEIPVHWEPKVDYRVSPSRLLFTANDGSKEFRQLIRVEPLRSGGDLPQLHADCSEDFISCQEVPRGRSATSNTWKVSLDLEQWTGQESGYILFSDTNGVGQFLVRVYILK